jgi:hypothetical protein
MNTPIVATMVTLVFDVSAAPIYTPKYYVPMFPQTLRVEIYNGERVLIYMSAFKAKKDGTKSSVMVNPHILSEHDESAPWIAECIEKAKIYATNAKWVNGQGAVL